MDAVEALERLGGIASLHALLDLTTRRRLRTAVQNQSVRKAGHDRYALPAADQARRTAVASNGFITHISAAMHWGWEVRFSPRRPQIAIPHGRPLPQLASAQVRRLPRSAVPGGGFCASPGQR